MLPLIVRILKNGNTQKIQDNISIHNMQYYTNE